MIVVSPLKKSSRTSKENYVILGPSYRVWRLLQEGQDQIIRFSKFTGSFGKKIRWQNGHEHRCSVSFLFTDTLLRIRPYVKLDELLITRCINIHDEPEGILRQDIHALLKTDQDDLNEYLAFENLYRPLGTEVWNEMQRCYLLQFALSNPGCFPDDAREIMGDLARDRKNEALFFDGVQRWDYIHYAFECHHERGLSEVLGVLINDNFQALEKIAAALPGFDRVIWTPERKEFFRSFLNKPI